MYSRLGKFGDILNKESTIFTIKELTKWIKCCQNKHKKWKWSFLDQKQLPIPYYTPINSLDNTLIFESRFESGNLLMAAKISDKEYKLLLQNDSLTNGSTQCFVLIIYRVLFCCIKYQERP